MIICLSHSFWCSSLFRDFWIGCESLPILLWYWLLQWNSHFNFAFPIIGIAAIHGVCLDFQWPCRSAADARTSTSQPKECEDCGIQFRKELGWANMPCSQECDVTWVPHIGSPSELFEVLGPCQLFLASAFQCTRMLSWKLTGQSWLSEGTSSLRSLYSKTTCFGAM